MTIIATDSNGPAIISEQYVTEQNSPIIVSRMKERRRLKLGQRGHLNSLGRNGRVGG